MADNLPAVKPREVPPPSDPITDALTRQLIVQTSSVKAMFEGLIHPQKEISEELFRINFLPYFCGELPTTKDVLHAWTCVAGTTLNPVSIVGAHGRVVAVVPPIADTSTIKMAGRTKLRGGATARDLVEQAAQRASLSPKMANNLLAQELHRKFNATTAHISEDRKQAWIELLTYFGKSIVPGVAAPNAPQALANESDFDYDDE